MAALDEQAGHGAALESGRSHDGAALRGVLGHGGEGLSVEGQVGRVEEPFPVLFSRLAVTGSEDQLTNRGGG
ncbi:hypothetical protein GCM10009612_64740 [Streptomyces beijiangensis]